MNDSILYLWQTCRVIASETRLRLLWEVFENSEMCVSALAEKSSMAPASASTQLRMLCDEGLIQDHRRGQQVYYEAKSTNAPPHILQLKTALKKCCDNTVSFQSIAYQATGFTHQRRIELLKRIAETSLSLHDLAEQTVMSPGALQRHIHKLEARQYIKAKGKLYTLSTPAGHLAKALVKIITESKYN